MIAVLRGVPDTPWFLVTRMNLSEMDSKTQFQNLLIACASAFLVAELERFAYTISHDLKSPIITIKGFTGSLERDLLRGNHERMAGDLKRVSDAADRMSDLLRDLMELTTIGCVTAELEPVKMNELLDDVLKQMSGSLQMNSTKIDIQPGLPTVLCDRWRIANVTSCQILQAL